MEPLVPLHHGNVVKKMCRLQRPTHMEPLIPLHHGDVLGFYRDNGIES